MYLFSHYYLYLNQLIFVLVRGVKYILVIGFMYVCVCARVRAHACVLAVCDMAVVQ